MGNLVTEETQLSLLDQKSREELLDYLINYLNKSEKLIIHIKARGGIEGICQIRSYSTTGRDGDKNSLIRWDKLTTGFNQLSECCDILIINLGTICNSIEISRCIDERKFYTIVTTESVADPVKPRKINKILLSDIDNTKLNDPYRLLKKRN